MGGGSAPKSLPRKPRRQHSTSASGRRTPASPPLFIYLAWQDRITFEEIKKETGLSEAEVI